MLLTYLKYIAIYFCGLAAWTIGVAVADYCAGPTGIASYLLLSAVAGLASLHAASDAAVKRIERRYA